MAVSDAIKTNLRDAPLTGDKRLPRGLLALLLGGLFIRLALSGLPGFVGDTNWMIGYVTATEQKGLMSVTDMWDDTLYPPVFIYQAVAGSRLVNAVSGQHTPASESDINAWARLGVRIGPIAYDVFIAALLFLTVRRWFAPSVALTASALYLFNPGTIANSALWNYDSLPSLLILLTLLFSAVAFETRNSRWLIAASIVNGLAFSSKLQAGMYIPVFGLVLLLTRDVRLILKCAVAFLAVTALSYLPFMLQGRWDYLKKVFFVSFQNYPVTHVNGFNVWGLWYQKPVSTRVLGITLEMFGRIGYLAAAAFGTFALWRANSQGGHASSGQPEKTASSPWEWNADASRRLAIISAYLCIAPFLFLTRMHERYIAPAVALAVLAGFLDPRLRKLAWGISLTYALNMVAVYFIAWRPWIEPGQPIIHPRIVTLCYIGIRVFASALNVGLFAWFSLMLRRTLAIPPPSACDSPSVANSLAFQPGLATTA